jgi:hypothetical protein
LPLASPLVSWFVHALTPKMEAKYSSETPIDFQRTTRRYIPEDGTLHNHRCEILNYYEAEEFWGKML